MHQYSKHIDTTEANWPSFFFFWKRTAAKDTIWIFMCKKIHALKYEQKAKLKIV